MKLLLSLALLCVVAVVGFAAWMYFYTLDLPDTAAMAVYSPGGPVVIQTKICGGPVYIVAIPGGNPQAFRQAILAVEGDFGPRNFLRRYSDELDHHSRYGRYSDQLAGQILCGSVDGPLKRTLRELRTAIQLERRFNHDQLLDIYVNRAFFGTGIYGVAEASRRYFGKHAEELSTAEAALLAGLIARPAYYSPIQHPDRALARRNEVIDAMLKRGSIQPLEAKTAKLAPMNLVQN